MWTWIVAAAALAVASSAAPAGGLRGAGSWDNSTRARRAATPSCSSHLDVDLVCRTVHPGSPWCGAVPYGTGGDCWGCTCGALDAEQFFGAVRSLYSVPGLDCCAANYCDGNGCTPCFSWTSAPCPDQPEPTAAPTPSPSPCTPTRECAPFDEWPDVDYGVTCGSCRALVQTAGYHNRCDIYCESFGHVCVAAAEEVDDNCEVYEEFDCSTPISGTSDMLCTCHESPCCAPFDEWPDVDHGVTCGSCRALVRGSGYSHRCDIYCESFGHVCVAAAEEVDENCEVYEEFDCSTPISGTSDMLCTCHEQAVGAAPPLPPA